MSYSVKELSEISKVSIRTLHYYDEINLLKPAYLSSCGYRYYEKEQLEKLQQILFFKELGFDLKKIKKILAQSKFDRLYALQTQREILKDNISRLQLLIKTIDKTIQSIKGDISMKDEDMYAGFSKEKQKYYEDFLITRYRQVAKNYISESQKRVKNWTKEDFESNKKAFEELSKELTLKLQEGLDPSSETVQKLIKKHYEMIKKFYTPTKEVYIGLGELYKTHKDFKKLYDKYDSRLAEYLAQAMKIFAETQLS